MSNKILVALVLFLVFNSGLKATHYAGSEISYRYIGDSTNISKHYLIRFTSYGFVNTSNLPNQVTIGYSSSCNSGSTVMANLLSNSPPGGSLIIYPYNCAGSQTNLSNFKKWEYEVAIALPVNCSDWEFWASEWGRNYVNNLNTNTAQDFLIKAKLNSFYKNNSPRILNRGARKFCANASGETRFSQHAIETDGDSLVYYFGQPEVGPYPGTPINFVSGYSINSPFTTANGVNLNPATGVTLFTPTQAEYVNFKLNIDEFRFDSTFNLWINIGTVTKEMQLDVRNDCNNSAINWSFQSSILNPNCGDSTLIFKTSVPVSCSSISHDGSDFIIYNSNGTPMPIRSADGFCNSGFTDSIKINLYFPISKNDSLHIVSKIGSDFNTLINYCGYELPEDDSISVLVNNCSNVGLEEMGIYSSIFPNPSSSFVEVEFYDASFKTIRLINPNGQILKEMDISQKSFKLDLKGLSEGLYLLQMQSKGNIEWARILKN